MIDEYLQSGRERPNKPARSFPSRGFVPEPTQRDYDRGHIERYFLRKVRTSDVIEVSQEQFEEFANSDYFISFSLQWKISGPRHDVFNDAGFPIETGVEDTNERILEQTEQSGIRDKLDDPLEFWDGRNRND